LKALLGLYGSTLHECRQDGAKFDTSHPAAYRFNATIAGIEEAGAILLIGGNPRWEAPLVNTRIRKALKAGARVFHIGPEIDLTYPVTHLGTDLSLLGNLPQEVSEAFQGKAGAAVILGMGALVHAGAYEAARAVAASLGASFNLLHTAASRMGALDLGFVTEGGIEAMRGADRGAEALFLLWSRRARSRRLHGNLHQSISEPTAMSVARTADVILPGAAYTRSTALM
jgi:NADH-quinone oxidoreductase subunit G